ncbi:MAG: tol-pal system YbgF family protein [Crocinitomicaceae bacterium]
MSLNPKHINQRLDRYFGGKMTKVEMHQLEKEALSDAFLKDAMDGYTENASGIKYYNQHLKKRFGFDYKYWVISILSIALIIMSTLYFTKAGQKPALISQADINKQIPDENISSQQEYEVIPKDIEQMETIAVVSQIQHEKIVQDFTENQTYHLETDSVSDDIILVDPNQLIFEEALPEIIITKQERKIITYPYRYYYDMAVVDYARFENREKLINKTVYTFSGLDASFESDSARNNHDLIEQTVQVSYLEYLEETIYYFSKDKYKNALKRLNTISLQYKNDLNALFYGGLCYYNLGKFDKALESFKKVLQLKEGPFVEESKWYEAKTLLKLKRTKETKTLLAEIIMFNGYYAEQAATLLRGL